MLHFVIIGNGVAGVEAAMTLRERLPPAEAKITVISKEADYFFSRTALMYAFMEHMQRRDLEPHERQVYARQHINLVRDEVVALDAHAHTLTLRAAGAITYDRLLLAVGSQPARPPFKGLDAARDGVVHFVSMQDLDDCERLTPSTQRAVVVGGGLIGVELVECLLHHKVQTTFLVRESTYWPAALDPEEGELVAAHLRRHGVALRLSESLEEVLCDDTGRVSGARTSAGETLPCELLGVAVGVVAQIDWLREGAPALRLGRGVCVDRSFATNLPDVWAAGDCAEIAMDDAPPIRETIWYSAKRHGRLAAQAMMGDRVRYTPPLFFNSSKFFELEFTTVGHAINLPPDATELIFRDAKREISARFVFDASGALIGANLLGSRWDHRILEAWIMQRRPIEFVEPRLPHAQFDVEFGRVKLDKLTRLVRPATPETRP